MPDESIKFVDCKPEPMFKKIDRLIFNAFLGPFILTLAVVVFILLTNQMVQWIDHLVGKGLSWTVFAELIFYFALHFVPLGLPLAILLSSLIVFGSLGEHTELTALKSSGISLLRVLRPIFIISIFLTIFSFWFADQVVPKVNLKAYSLLWDIKQKSPTLSLKEGAFYNGLPGYSIKVRKKLGKDGKLLRGVMIYNHTKNQGNNELILADSGRMYTIMNERYLVLELFNGSSYHDQAAGNITVGNSNEKYVINTYDKSQIVFSLSSFDMKKTDEQLFAGHRVMHDAIRLSKDIDSLEKYSQLNNEKALENFSINYFYHLKTTGAVVKDIRAKTQAQKIKLSTPVMSNPIVGKKQILNRAVNQARNMQQVVKSRSEQMQMQRKELKGYYVEFYKKFTLAFACITMFLIGAPLGAIIKKGGLGLPVLIAIIFFILFYIMMITGEKWVKEDYVPVVVGMWMGNFILFWVGLFFLRQAKNDSRILEGDAFMILRDRIKSWYQKRKPAPKQEEIPA
jgi:lipopolysaccharide export system permease protein